MAVFLMAPFTESLFLALTLGAFLAAYRTALVCRRRPGRTGQPHPGAWDGRRAAFAVLAWQQWSCADRDAVPFHRGAVAWRPSWRRSSPPGPSWPGGPRPVSPRFRIVLEMYVNTVVVDPLTAASWRCGSGLRSTTCRRLSTSCRPLALCS